MNPCIAHFLGDNRQRIGVACNFICYNRKIRWDNLRVGKTALQVRKRLGYFFRRVRSAVIASDYDGNGSIGIRDNLYAAISRVIHDGDGSARSVLPLEQAGENRRRACIVDANIQECYTGRGKRLHNSASMAGHVGHFGAGRRASESSIQSSRQSNGSGDHARIHHLRLPAKGKRVPCYVARVDRIFHALALVAIGPLKVFIKQPRSRSPHIFRRSFLAERRRRGDCFWKIIFKVAFDNGGLSVNEPCVKMALEYGENSFDA